MTKMKVKSLLIGMILGDGWLRKHPNGGYEIAIQHSIRQKDYLQWKVDLVGDCFSNQKIRDVFVGSYSLVLWRASFKDKQLGEELTSALYAFKKTKGKRRKRITNKVLADLNDKGVAIWYMDDGSMTIKKRDNRYHGRHYNLCTHSYTKEENELIQKYFSNNYDVKSRIHFQRNYPMLYFNSTEMKKIQDRIKDYIIPSMRYKLFYDNLNKYKDISAPEKDIVRTV